MFPPLLVMPVILLDIKTLGQQILFCMLLAALTALGAKTVGNISFCGLLLWTALLLAFLAIKSFLLKSSVIKKV